MARRKANPYDFSEEAIKKRRTFPIGRLIALMVLVIVQIACILFAIYYNPTPDDKIDKYEIYVVPRDDGTLDIEYKLRWTPLSSSEPLT